MRPAYDRLVEDWDDDGEPPGQYIVFGQLYERLIDILLALPASTSGRPGLLRRAIAFGEELLAAKDPEVRSLGIDSMAETLALNREGRAIAEEFGGGELNRWFASEAHDWWPPRDEIIDLWGVREVIAPVLADIALTDIPGISHPADYRALPSLPKARAHPDGVALLASYGTTRLYVVVPAAEVECQEAALQEAAQSLATRLGGAHARGAPGVHYRTIPRGERVWNMDVGSARHTRLGDAPWIADELGAVRVAILDLLGGRTPALPL